MSTGLLLVVEFLSTCGLWPIWPLCPVVKWQPNHHLDAYIIERQKSNDENDQESSFFGVQGDDNFVTSMIDLFIAGSETTSTTLTFAILLMLHDPKPFKVHTR